MKKNLLAAGFIAVMAISSGCGPSMKVSSDYDKGVDFKKYKSFSIYSSGKLNEAVSQLNQQRILTAIRNEMIRKGFQETSSSPDLLVNPVAIFKDKVSVVASTNYYAYGGAFRPYYWGGGGMADATTNYDVRQYKDGSLIIDIIDAATKNLVWHGVGNSEIDAPLKDPDTKIPKAIESIMAGFPPGMSKK